MMALGRRSLWGVLGSRWPLVWGWLYLGLMLSMLGCCLLSHPGHSLEGPE